MIDSRQRSRPKERPVGPGELVHASDRQYVTDKNPSTLRLATPKVRGKKARAADKLRRRQARR